MTRQEAINHWAAIVRTVFAAEDNIMKDWHARLKAARNKSKEEQQQISDKYCEAVATEIISRTTDDELANM